MRRQPAPVKTLPSIRKPRSPRVPRAEQAWRTLRDQIYANELPPGFRALEEELAVRLRMSRTPVHEALIRLESEGLIRVEPRRGVVVLPIAPDDLRQIYEVVIAVETQAVELVALRRLGGAALDALRDAVVAMERAVASQDRAAWADADDRFHRTLLDLCGNPRLAAIAQSQRDQVRRARLITLYRRMLPLRSAQRHRDTYEAIAAGDAEGARELHRKGWQQGAAELTELLRTMPADAF